METSKMSRRRCMLRAVLLVGLLFLIIQLAEECPQAKSAAKKTKLPVLEVDYSTASRIKGKRMYYDQSMNVMFTITDVGEESSDTDDKISKVGGTYDAGAEISISSETFDTEVEISRDGGAYKEAKPDWESTYDGIYTGCFSITARKDHSADGEYRFRVTYMDRGKKEQYLSDFIVIDTVNRKNVAQQEAKSNGSDSGTAQKKSSEGRATDSKEPDAAGSRETESKEQDTAGSTGTDSKGQNSSGSRETNSKKPDAAGIAGTAVGKQNSRKQSEENQKKSDKKNSQSDTAKLSAPKILINGKEADGQICPGAISLRVRFSDLKDKDYKMRLVRCSYHGRDKEEAAFQEEDVTEAFLGDGIRQNSHGWEGEFHTFERKPENDGVYKLTLSVSDKAGHKKTVSAVFMINRYGSRYIYEDVLDSLLLNKEKYHNESGQDLILTEYNPCGLRKDAGRIEIFRNGRPMDRVKWDVMPVAERSETGESEVSKTDKGKNGETDPGHDLMWKAYRYVISGENFAADGLYQLQITSKDLTGHNTNTDMQKAIRFRIDQTAPEIQSITGLEHAIVNATEQRVCYQVYDTGGLASVRIFVDGNEIQSVHDFGGDMNHYAGDFVLDQSSKFNSVRLIVTDLAGNKSDTEDRKFKIACAFPFHDTLTVSTSGLIQAVAWMKKYFLLFPSITGAIIFLKCKN